MYCIKVDRKEVVYKPYWNIYPCVCDADDIRELVAVRHHKKFIMRMDNEEITLSRDSFWTKLTGAYWGVTLYDKKGSKVLSIKPKNWRSNALEFNNKSESFCERGGRKHGYKSDSFYIEVPTIRDPFIEFSNPDEKFYALVLLVYMFDYQLYHTGTSPE